MAKKSQKKFSRPSRRPTLIILALSLTLGIGLFLYQTYFRPEPIEIMAINPVDLTYGDTTVQGTIRQDPDGNFLLALSDMRAIILDVAGIDNLDGHQVVVSGNLQLIDQETALPLLKMQVYSITVETE